VVPVSKVTSKKHRENNARILQGKLIRGPNAGCIIITAATGAVRPEKTLRSHGAKELIETRFSHVFCAKKCGKVPPATGRGSIGIVVTHSKIVVHDSASSYRKQTLAEVMILVEVLAQQILLEPGRVNI